MMTLLLNFVEGIKERFSLTNLEVPQSKNVFIFSLNKCFLQDLCKCPQICILNYLLAFLPASLGELEASKGHSIENPTRNSSDTVEAHEEW